VERLCGECAEIGSNLRAKPPVCDTFWSDEKRRRQGGSGVSKIIRSFSHGGSHRFESYSAHHRFNDLHRNSFWRGAILRTIKILSCCFAFAVLGRGAILSAQQSKGPAPAPVPVQIGAAQKVFISNAGGESFETVIDQTVFNGGPDRPYNEFYADVKSWGRYEIVSSPADADLVLEISWVLTDTGLKLPVLGQLRLVVVDPKTHVTLWNFTEYVRGAILLGNRDKNFDQAMNTIVGRMRSLTSPPPATTDAGQK
jgi:hypothetical protein